MRPDRKIAFCFFGLNRSLSLTCNSILKNVIDPFREICHVDLFAAFSVPPSVISNPHSGEMNVLTERNHSELLCFKSLYEFNQDEFDALLQFDSIAEIMSDAYGDAHKSTRNIFRSLFSLKKVHEVASACAEYDYYFFLRPDLFFIDLFDPNPILDYLDSSKGSCIVTPVWQQWGGLNDRIAVCSGRTASKFASRFDSIMDFYSKTNEAIHSEKMLLWFCIRNGISYDYFFNERAIRVRANGVFWEEHFNQTGFSSYHEEKYRKDLV